MHLLPWKPHLVSGAGNRLKNLAQSMTAKSRTLHSPLSAVGSIVALLGATRKIEERRPPRKASRLSSSPVCSQCQTQLLCWRTQGCRPCGWHPARGGGRRRVLVSMWASACGHHLQVFVSRGSTRTVASSVSILASPRLTRSLLRGVSTWQVTSRTAAPLLACLKEDVFCQSEKIVSSWLRRRFFFVCCVLSCMSFDPMFVLIWEQRVLSRQLVRRPPLWWTVAAPAWRSDVMLFRVTLE